MNAAPIKNLLARFKTKPAEHDSADKQCGNCNTQVIGNYCHFCGQSAHVHHSLLHLIEEMVHGLWHFDAKGWRTIPLLVAYPGELTRRYIDGQRVRFISPLGLFLFMVFFMFFSFSFFKGDALNLDNGDAPENRAAIEKQISDQKVKVNQAQINLEQAKKSGVDVEGKQDELDSAQEDEKELETTLAAIDHVKSAAGGQADHTKFELDDSKIKVDGANASTKATVKNVIKHLKENKDLVLYKMKNNAYKFALILVPLSLPVLWIMFIGKKNITMFDHAIFSLYSLSFMAFLLAVVSLLIDIDFGGMAMLLLFFVPPIHMYRQLKVTYQLSVLGTLWRTAFLVIAACIMLLMFVLFVLAMSAS